MIVTIGLAAITLDGKAIAQMDIRLAEPSGLNMTGNTTGNATNSGQELIPTANVTAGPEGCVFVGEGSPCNPGPEVCC